MSHQGSKVVLVIDDEELIRSQICAVLEKEGFTVHEARDGNEGLTNAALAVPDLVITDILMPEKEGIETIIELRRHHPHVRIIAMSGGGRTGNPDFLKLAQHFGADRTFAKPFRPADLIKAVRELIALGPAGNPDSTKRWEVE